MNIHVLRFTSPLGESAEQESPTDIHLKLDGFNIQNRTFGSDGRAVGPPWPNSRNFTDFELQYGDFAPTDNGNPNTPDDDLQGFRIEDDFGGVNDVPAFPFLEKFLDSGEFTTYRGRTTSVQFYINDAMIDVDPVTGYASLNRQAFLDANANPETGKMRGFLNDYLEFDISAVPNRPQMPAPLQFPPQESRASRVFFSGDGYAIGDKDARGVNGSNGLFVYLTPSSFFEGFYRVQDPTTNLKTFELKQADPTYIGPDIRLITALKGVYRTHTEVLSNLHDVEFILLPKSGDGPKQDVVVIKRNGGTIADMWFGTADFSGSGSPTFRIYPIRNLYPASTSGEIRGTFPANQLDGVGGGTVSSGTTNYWRDIRYGQYRFDSTIPSGLSKTGDFVVFRI